MTELKEIYIVASPRSGLTWLTRMLGDALDSPLQAHNDTAEPEYFGEGRDGGYIIRKSHDPVTMMDWDAPTIFTQRDPRDVAVSRMFYRRLEPTEANLMATIKSFINVIRPYDNYIRCWQEREGVIFTTYEKLQSIKYHCKYQELYRILDEIPNTSVSMERIREVIEYQSFKNVIVRYGERFQGSMHKGIVGNWKNYFTRKSGEYITDLLGALMLETMYISDLNWWRELDD